MLLKRIHAITNKFFNKCREIGFFPTVDIVFSKIKSKLKTNKGYQIIQAPLSSSYDVILNGLKYAKKVSNQQDNHIPKSQSKELEFVWLVPFFSKGSGGHKTLFRFVKGLEDMGCKCHVYIVGEYDVSLTTDNIRNQIREYFEPINADVKIYYAEDIQEESDIVVCTSWITAYAALTFNANSKIYFVQDYEPSFYSLGSYWYLAEQTYKFGYYHITHGAWLTNFLRESYESQADYYDIAVDRNIYYPRTKIKNPLIKKFHQDKNFKVCFYGRSVTPRRCFELVAMALHLFSEKVDQITLISYGWNDIPALSFSCHNLGMLSPDELAELYSVCDVCIALSATNISLVAHESIACGCVLMDLAVENTADYLMHLQNSYLVKPLPTDICDGLINLYQDRELLKNIKQSSFQYISEKTGWENQVQKLYSLVKSYDGNASDRASQKN
ncbi:glycosyltransferase [Chamaesiphon sp. VAR_48_metabat_403]|uniref:rhamnosyltransferase WsaF family glycosyltransferase n=1 Tax=Chamaesiphon sp. VAR_48_metabat_403 TaxID=2964700 RepID=UPI00286E26AA|nr:glycosyltransferase [Chamaesiphon sp. VAR_48_metabat_403]